MSHYCCFTVFFDKCNFGKQTNKQTSKRKEDRKVTFKKEKEKKGHSEKLCHMCVVNLAPEMRKIRELKT